MSIDHEFVGKSPAVAKLLDEIEKAAQTDLPVLIEGETGTGKELVARAIHRNSRRRDQRMVSLNCVGLDKSLLASELFGHEKGGFTGADRQRIGKFELAHGGTLFLDEIGDMAPALQPELLRVLEEKVIERVGGSTPIPVDARIISATNQKLGAAIQEGKFRFELYQRLNVLPIRTPALREHKEDIPALVEHFISRYRNEGRSPVWGISQEAMAALLRYDWHGNVRELRNVIWQAIAMGAHGEMIEACDLRELVEPKREATRLGDRSVKIKQDLALDALRVTHGNMTRAAMLLGVHPRTLRRLMEKGES